MSTPPVLSPEPSLPVNVTPDGELRKTIVVPGEGDPAGRRAKVTIKYTLYLATSSAGNDAAPHVIDSSDSQRRGTLTFTQGRRKVLPALDVLVEGMRQGEVARATAGPSYAFGRRGLPRKGVPPNASVDLTVELLEFSGGEQPKTLDEMTPRERVEQATLCKEAGNNLFKEAKYEKARVQYSQCIFYVEKVFYGYKGDANKAGKANGERPNEEAEALLKNETEPGVKDDTEKGREAISTAEEDDGFEEAKVEDESVEKEEEEEEEVIETLDVSTASAPIEDADADVEQSLDGTVAETEGNGKVPTGDEMTNGHAAEDDCGDGNGEEEQVQDEDLPTTAEVQSLHVTALNNLSLCLVKLELFQRAVQSATRALQMDPDSSKAFYHR